MRWNDVRCAAIGAVAVITWLPVEPLPITPTRLPVRSRSSGHAPVCTRRPSKSSMPGKFGHVGRRQQAQPVDQEPALERDAAVGVHGPDAGDLVEFGVGHRGLERDVLAQVVAVHDAVEVLEDLGLAHELRLPRRLRVEVAVERVLVDEALGVRQRSGVLVPVPGAAHPAGLVDGHGVEAQFVAQLVQHVDAAESGADDEGVESVGSGRWYDCSPWRVRSLVRQHRCGAVHFPGTMVCADTTTCGVPIWNTARTPTRPRLIPQTQKFDADYVLEFPDGLAHSD